MPVTGPIFAMDLGARCGFCTGIPGDAKPLSGTFVLKKPAEPRAVAFSNLICALNEHWSEVRPALVVKEAMLPLQAFSRLGNAAHTVRMTAGLHAIVEAMCVRFGVQFEDIADSTVRKHFIGAANTGGRAGTKAAVVNRAKLLGYLPADCEDDNRADACATWDYAAHTFGHALSDKLHLFGERAA